MAAWRCLAKSTARKAKWSLVLCGMLACQTAPVAAPAKRQFKPDPALLLTWKEPIKNENNLEPPYIAKFSAAGKTLWYVASIHDNNVESDTFKLIKRVFDENEPQALIIEGVEKKPEPTAESYGGLVRNAELGKTRFWIYGEPSYAVAFALKNELSCTSGEPSGAYIRAHLNKEFTLKDLFGFYVVRQIPEIRRQDPGGQTGFDEWFITYAAILARDAGIPAPSLNEFKAWYAEKNRKRFVFEEIDGYETAPICSKTASHTQKISCDIGTARNTAILETIADMLNMYDRVLIVYGGGHFEVERNALEHMLGKAEFIKL